MSEGLLKTIFRDMKFGGIPLTPTLANNELVISITQEELKQMLLANADERAKSCVSVECKEGRLILKIRLL